MKILITGGEGFLGSYLVNYLSNAKEIRKDFHGFENKVFKHFSVTGTYFKQIPILNKNYIKIDIINKESLKKIEELKPDIIIHCAAIKDVPYCEEHKEECYNVNVNGTKNIIDICKKINAKLIFISTDYVFKGDKGNYKEDSIKEPTTVYGKTKSEAEDLIINSNINYAICRTSGIYSFFGNNFLTFVLSKLKKNEKINAFTNVYNSPTYINNLAEIILEIIKRNKNGIFHIVGAEKINRYDFAIKIAKIFNFNESLIKEEIDNSSRPKNTSLNTEKAQKELKVKFLTIEKGLNDIKNKINYN